MRRNSPKQIKASRENGAKSKGPKSKTGKSKSAQNAIQNGLFSRQVVIEHLGEKQADYDEAKELLWRVLQPSNTLEEMLVTDFAENWWRRERIRRAERIELENRLAWLDLRSDLRRDDEVEALRSQFFFQFGMCLKAYSAGSLEAVGLIITELEEARQHLASTTVGIDFLIGLLEYLAAEAKTKGVLSDQNEVLLKACCGFGSKETDTCLKFNQISKRESRKWVTDDSEQPAKTNGENPSERDTEILRLAIRLQKGANEYAKKKEAQTSDDEPIGKRRPEQSPTDKQAKAQEDEPVLGKAECCAALAAVISHAAANLRTRRIKFELIEAAEGRRATSLASSDPSSSDRFSRAETAVERRMYRALAALAAMRARGISNLLPEPKLKNSK